MVNPVALASINQAIIKTFTCYTTQLEIGIFQFMLSYFMLCLNHNVRNSSFKGNGQQGRLSKVDKPLCPYSFKLKQRPSYICDQHDNHSSRATFMGAATGGRTSVMIRRLAMRRRVLGPKWLVTMTRRPASGNLNLEGLAFMISSTITTDPRL